jgi:hypothetical protein
MREENLPQMIKTASPGLDEHREHRGISAAGVERL